MYCPHCGREMVLIDDVFTCVVGEMPLSQVMHQRLSERFPVSKAQPKDVEIGQVLKRWYCPGCGVPLGDRWECPSCGKTIRDQLYQLVELHPHRSV